MSLLPSIKCAVYKYPNDTVLHTPLCLPLRAAKTLVRECVDYNVVVRYYVLVVVVVWVRR